MAIVSDHRLCDVTSPDVYDGAANTFFKSVPSREDRDPDLLYKFLGPTRVCLSIASRSVHPFPRNFNDAISAQLTCVPHRHTDHATCDINVQLACDAFPKTYRPTIRYAMLFQRALKS